MQDAIDRTIAHCLKSGGKAQYIYPATVTSVYDGDTVRVTIDVGFHYNRVDTPIRLWGIDTPELRGGERPDGIKVRDWVSEQVLGKKVVLESIEDNLGKYGRVLGIIWPVGWDSSLNGELIRRDYAGIPDYMNEKEVLERFFVG